MVLTNLISKYRAKKRSIANDGFSGKMEEEEQKAKMIQEMNMKNKARYNQIFD